MRFPLRSACVVLALSSISFAARMQDPPSDSVDENGGLGLVTIAATPPPTRLESLLIRPGVLVIKGFTPVGITEGDGAASGSVRIYAVEAKAAGATATGLAVEVRNGTHVAVSYVDRDEAVALLTAMDDLTKLDHAVTQLDEFDGHYRTKGNLEIGNRNVDGVRTGTVRAWQSSPQAGQFTWATARLNLGAFSQVRRQLAAGIDALNRLAPAEK